MSGAFMWQLQHHFCFTISWSQFKTARHLTHEIALLYVMGTGIWQEHFLVCSLLFSVSTWCRVTSVLKSVRLIWRSDSSRAIGVASSCLLWNVKEWRRRKIRFIMGKTSDLPDKTCDIYRQLCEQQAQCSVGSFFIPSLFMVLAFLSCCTQLTCHRQGWPQKVQRGASWLHMSAQISGSYWCNQQHHVF